MTTTMGSLGFDPSLEAVRSGTDGVGHAFTVGLRYAFLIMMGMILSAMIISVLQQGRAAEQEQVETTDLEESQAEA